MYRKYIKRLMDIILSFIAIIVLLPVFLVVGVLVRIKLGSPVLFKQKRPGLNEKIFTLYKFRTMTDKKDENGELLPDSERLTRFGKILRSTSLDELPELFNILIGDMSIVGPRPQLIKDMVFMSQKQRLRHNAMPGLTGLAQIKGRNEISWEEKLNYDIQYVSKISFVLDVKIICKTITSVMKREGISSKDMATAEDLGDYLLRLGIIDSEIYSAYIEESNRLSI